MTVSNWSPISSTATVLTAFELGYTLPQLDKNPLDQNSSPSHPTTIAGPSSYFSPTSGIHSSEEFDRSGFLQQELLSGIVPTQLNGPIHNIFSHSKFSSEAGFDHTKMTTTLKLTTQFMIHSLPVFHALFSHREITAADELDQFGQPMYVFPEPLERLTVDQAAWTWARISRIGQHIGWSVSDRYQGTGVNAVTYSCLNGVLVGLDLDLFGTPSNIEINSDLYQALVASQQDTTDTIHEQSVCFNFATNILHELAHAAFNGVATYTHHKTQFFLGENGHSTEHGFELTAWLFGGLPEPYDRVRSGFLVNLDTNQCSGAPGMMTVCQWPCPTKSIAYQSCGAPFATRGDEKTSQILWTTSFLHISQMCQDSFWSSEKVQKQGRKALHFPQGAGYQFVWAVDGYVDPLIPHPSETFDAPNGYWIDKNGLIRKRVDKLARMEKSKTRVVELAIRVQKIVVSGETQKEWDTPPSRVKKVSTFCSKLSTTCWKKAKHTGTQVTIKVKYIKSASSQEPKEPVKIVADAWDST